MWTMWPMAIDRTSGMTVNGTLVDLIDDQYYQPFLFSSMTLLIFISEAIFYWYWPPNATLYSEAMTSIRSSWLLWHYSVVTTMPVDSLIPFNGVTPAFNDWPAILNQYVVPLCYLLWWRGKPVVKDRDGVTLFWRLDIQWGPDGYLLWHCYWTSKADMTGITADETGPIDVRFQPQRPAWQWRPVPTDITGQLAFFFLTGVAGQPDAMTFQWLFVIGQIRAIEACE